MTLITTGVVDSEKTGCATKDDDCEAVTATVVRVVTDISEVEGKFC